MSDRYAIFTTLLCTAVLSSTGSLQGQKPEVKNIVLNVSIVQEPETSFKEDVAATKRVLAQQHGPCILVAHSYGGAKRTHSQTVEVTGASHSAYVSHPREVAAVIESAARGVSK